MRRTRASGRLAAVAIASTFVAGCTKPPRPQADSASAGSHAHAGAAAGRSSALLASQARPHIPKVTQPAPPAATWVEAMRMFDWHAALSRIEELPDEERSAPPVRFARAFAASRLGKHQEALDELRDLETLLPLLSDEIVELRKRGRIEVGPDVEVAGELAKGTRIDDLLSAAALYQKAGRLLEAKNAVDRAWRAHRKRKSVDRQAGDEARIRRLRAEVAIAQKRKNQAIVDLTWLSTATPTEPAAVDADVRLEELAGRTVLSKRQRYDRAEAFAKQGAVARVERELDLLAKAPGAGPKHADTVRTLAWAVYRSREDYERAATLFAESARLDGAHRLSDSFHSARALSRANRDADAIARYDEIAAKYPGTFYGEQARYLGGRLSFILGDYADAEKRYADYLRRHGKKKGRRRQGRFESAVHYERAITRLAAEDYATAEKLLKPFVTRGSDRERARMLQLHAVALLGADRREEAAAEFRRVVSNRPLSFAASASLARLRRMGEVLPPTVPPGTMDPLREPLEIELPPKAALLSSVGLDVDAEQVVFEMEATLQREHSPRGGEALCALYGKLTTAYRRYRAGQRIVRDRVLEKAPSPADAWTWDCVYPRPYQQLVDRYTEEYRLPQGVVHAVMRQESAFRPDARSPANASGLMQLIPSTARRAAEAVGVGHSEGMLTSPAHNLRLGSYYFGRVLERFGSRVALAAAAYNAGPHAVSRWLAAGEQLPLDVWTAAIPYSETREYVYRVMGNWARYQYLEGGEPAVSQLELDIPSGMRAQEGDY